MHALSQPPAARTPAWFREADCSVDEFATLIETARDTSRRPSFASDLKHAVPVYDCDALRPVLADATRRRVCSRTCTRPFSTRSTVAVPRPACNAISLIRKGWLMAHRPKNAARGLMCF